MIHSLTVQGTGKYMFPRHFFNALIGPCIKIQAKLLAEKELTLTSASDLKWLKGRSQPPPPFSFSHFFTRANIFHKNQRRGSAWYGTPPTCCHLASLLTMVMAAMRSFVHYTALTLLCGS